MRRTAMCLAVIVVVAAVLPGRAQTPSFEVASVKPNDVTQRSASGAPVIRPEQFLATRAPIHYLVSLAYSVSAARITGWPEWTERAYYDIRAKTGKPSTRQEVLA